MLNIKDIQKIVSIRAKEYGAENVFPFGSYARGEATENSDVDLRLDKGSIIGGVALAGLLLDLEDDLGLHVDLVTTGCLSPKFLDEIRGEEKLLYAREQRPAHNSAHS